MGTGNNSPTYLLDPHNAATMRNIFVDYSLYTVATVNKLMTEQVKRYDDYLKNSDYENKQMYIKTCDSAFTTVLRKRCKFTDVTFPQLFMYGQRTLKSTWLVHLCTCAPVYVEAVPETGVL